ncbi:MAG: hypothetical protein ACLFTK_09480 [Anaerolineales bacterium]
MILRILALGATWGDGTRPKHEYNADMRTLYLLLTSLMMLAMLFGALATPAPRAQAASLASFGAVTFQNDYPFGIISRVTVTPGTTLVGARLHLTMDGVTTYVQDAIIPAHITGQVITLETRWNGQTVTRDPSPPWMNVQFWWSVTDANGHTQTTAPQQHTYADTQRRPWVATQGTHTTVYTYSQSASFNQRVLNIAEAAYGRLQNTYGFALPYRPALVFYNTAAHGDADFGHGPAPPFGAFVVGRAYPGTSGVVMLARNDTAYLERVITHEMAHLYQYQIGMQLFEAPHWWIEGDARAQEPNASDQFSLNYARDVAANGGLPRLIGWDTRDYSTEAELNHAIWIGASFVLFLQAEYGTAAHAQFYGNWRASGDFYTAFELTYGRSLETLSINWQDWVFNRPAGAQMAEAPASANAAPIMLPPVPDGMARVNAYWLNFRDGPSLDHEVVHLLSIGQLVLPMGRDESGEWLLAELPDGTQGWLFSEYIDLSPALAAIDELTVSFYIDPEDPTPEAEQE